MLGIKLQFKSSMLCPLCHFPGHFIFFFIIYLFILCERKRETVAQKLHCDRDRVLIWAATKILITLRENLNTASAYAVHGIWSAFHRQVRLLSHTWAGQRNFTSFIFIFIFSPYRYAVVQTQFVKKTNIEVCCHLGYD